MSFVDDIRETLNDPDLEEGWNETIESMIEDEDKKDELLEWIREYRDEFLALTEDVQDPDEIRTSLILRYVEIKAHWMMLNTQMQYQAVNTGGADSDIMVKGSIISHLLEELENFLDEEEVEKLAEFLSQPMDKLSGDELP
ncbi:MAG: hypothetical protein ABEK50_15240 [bacterium]